MSWLGDIGDFLGGGSGGSGIGSALVAAGANLLGGLYQADAQKEAAEDERQMSKDDAILKLQLEELKAKYGLLGKGGGGGGGGGTDRTAALLNAYQNFIASNRAARDRQSQAFQELSRATQAPLIR